MKYQIRIEPTEIKVVSNHPTKLTIHYSEYDAATDAHLGYGYVECFIGPDFGRGLHHGRELPPKLVKLYNDSDVCEADKAAAIVAWGLDAELTQDGEILQAVEVVE